MKYLSLLLFPLACFASAPELYVTAGQSNMVGAGAKAEPLQLLPNPQIETRGMKMRWEKNETDWEATLGTAPADLGKNGFGPWWAFAQVMAAAKPNQDIRILRVAVSGSPLKEWIKGGKHYETAIPLIQEAIADGMELKGIIWHQGEAGTGLKKEDNGPDYPTMFAQMVNDFRVALDRPDLPFVAGTIGQSGRGGQVNNALDSYVGKIPAYAMAITTDRSLSDNVHYDLVSANALGVEMARQMLSLQGLPLPAILPESVTHVSRPEWKTPPGTRELLVTGDTSITANKSVNLGSTPRLYTQAGDRGRTTYLRFTDLPANSRKATLVINTRAVPNASATLTATRLSTDFDEATLTSENTPALSDATVSATVNIPEGLVMIDVSTLLVPGETTLRIALTTDGSKNPLVIDSREGDFAPRLVIQ